MAGPGTVPPKILTCELTGQRSGRVSKCPPNCGGEEGSALGGYNNACTANQENCCCGNCAFATPPSSQESSSDPPSVALSVSREPSLGPSIAFLASARKPTHGSIGWTESLGGGTIGVGGGFHCVNVFVGFTGRGSGGFGGHTGVSGCSFSSYT